MRILISTLVLASLSHAPLFCQTEKEGGAASNQELELKACGPKEKEVKYVADTDKKKHPLGESAPGTSLIYVLRPSLMGNKVQTKLAVDGEWKGVNRGNNYFFFNVQPGVHYFCSQAENRSTLELTVEAGKTYYLQQHVRMGVMKARNELTPMDEAEGQKKLASAHPSTWEVK